jgi:hypothetical protein
LAERTTAIVFLLPGLHTAPKVDGLLAAVEGIEGSAQLTLLDKVPREPVAPGLKAIFREY